MVSEAVSVNQDTASDPLSASAVMTFTTTERSANMYFSLADIPVGSNVDLYLSDGVDIISSSLNTDNADEYIKWSPDAGEYRFGAGEEYTLYVLGEDVPDGSITPNLMVWSDEVNIWLSTTSPDVTVSAIDPGETVNVIVNYAKDGWIPGDSISARFIVGSLVIDGAFDEYVTITKGGRALFIPIIARQ